MKKIILLLFMSSLNAQTINFETTVPANWSVSSGTGTLSISNEHYKLGNESLEWSWSAGDVITITNPQIDPTAVLNYNKHTTNLKIYNETSSNKKITLQYLDASGVVNYYFDIILDFTGWRRIARSFKYDMHGISGATTNIATLKIIAPTTGTGKLFFDDWLHVTNRYNRVATPYMPDVSGFLSNSDYYNFSNLQEDIPLTTPTATQLTDIVSIHDRLINLFKGVAPSVAAVNAADVIYNNLNIVVTGGKIKGKVATPQSIDDALEVYARDYYHNGTTSSLTKATNLVWLVNDAGYAAGSDLIYGWYDTRKYFAALSLVYESLPTNLQVKVVDGVKWTLHIGEQWDTNPSPGISPDHIHTNMIYVLAHAVIMQNSDDEKLQYLLAYKRFLEIKSVASTGHEGWFKPDGTSFHHRAHYYAYMYAFNSYTTILNSLKGTEFQINQAAYEPFRDVAYTYLIFSNGESYANSLCGRHPFSTTRSMTKTSYNQLAYIGGDILGQTADPFLAKAYNRIWGDDTTLNSYGSEAFPEGFWQYNYSPVAVFRKDNWTTTIHGINNEFWGTEIYSTGNRFGRYQSYGAVETIYPGGSVGSGYKEEGFDWNKPSGTTTKELSWTDLNPPATRSDEFADSNFAAALRFNEVSGGIKENQGVSGMYGFKFKQKGSITPSHDDSFTFNKSMFCFDDMIICLGSNINSTDNTNPIVTTLFQNSLSTTADAITVNGNLETSFPLNTNVVGVNWLINSWNTGYYVNTPLTIQIVKKNHDSPHKFGNGTFTNGNISYATINHGTAPVNSTYEYVIKPNTTAIKMQDFYTNMQNTTTAAYEILQQDANAHIIHYKVSNVFAYSLFEANQNSVGILKENDKPCMVMLNETNSILNLTLVNPKSAIAQTDTILITLNGEYSIISADAGVQLVSSSTIETILSFQPIQGKPLDVSLSNVGALGISEVNKLANLIIIYPNPTKGLLDIKTDKGVKVEHVTVVDLLGRHVVSFKNTTKIDISHLSKGSYILKIKTNKNIVSKKISVY